MNANVDNKQSTQSAQDAALAAIKAMGFEVTTTVPKATVEGGKYGWPTFPAPMVIGEGEEAKTHYFPKSFPLDGANDADPGTIKGSFKKYLKGLAKKGTKEADLPVFATSIKTDPKSKKQLSITIWRTK